MLHTISTAPRDTVQPPEPGSAGGRLRRAWNFYQPAIAIFLISRILFYLVVFAGKDMLPVIYAITNPVQERYGWGMAAHYRWNALNYLQIATDGYPASIAEQDGGNLAFFPLLPLAMRAVGLGSELASAVGGIVLVHLASLLAFCMLYWLAMDDTGDAETSRRAVFYTALFPLAFFYAVPYTESFFLALSVGFFVALRRRKWMWAGAAIALASICRLAGVLLGVVMAVELGLLLWRGGLVGRDRLRAALGLAIAPLGMLAYMAYLLWHTGDLLAFQHAQSHWDRETMLPPLTLARGIGYALNPALTNNAHLYMIGAINTVIVFAFTAIIALSWRRTPMAYTLYAALSLCLALVSPLAGPLTMQGTGRYAMVLFPVMIMMASWRSRPVAQALTIVMTVLYMLLTALFTHAFYIV